jgi:filamentous hemagglutinin family protein
MLHPGLIPEKEQCFMSHVLKRKLSRLFRPLALAMALVHTTALAASIVPPAPNTLPTGGQADPRQATITTSGNTMNVNQTSQNANIFWQTFSIGSGATVIFNQPNASAVAINRVQTSDPSYIFGKLTANGQVFFLNPAGILFGPTASVNVGGMVATTLNLNDGDFSQGKYSFTNGGAAGSVVNQGNLTAKDGGYLALLAPQVRNEGIISARLGTVALAAGNKIDLDFNGDGRINLTVDKGAVNALVENKNLVQADGGVVLMTAKAADALTRAVVNNEGVVAARTLQKKGGRILLLGDMDNGEVRMSGTLDASAPNGGDGGFIETSAKTVTTPTGFKVTTLAPQGKTGSWLIDPNDFIIAATGGNMTGADLATALNSSSVTIQTATQGTSGGNGDIFVNDAVAKTGAVDTTLTLLAERDINVNRTISSNNGKLNVVLTADADHDGAGNYNFAGAGQISTNGGNFAAGSVSGNNILSSSGNSFTMNTGSFVDAGAGTVGISVSGNLALTNVASGGSQTYSGGSTTVNGSLTTNGGTIDLSGVSGITLGGATTIKTDLAGGSTSAGILKLGAAKINGAQALTIDTTADGGGAAADLTLNAIGDSTQLSSLNVKSGSLTLNGAVKATRDITLQASGAGADINLNAPVTSSSGNIVLAAGRNFFNNAGASALNASRFHFWQVWSSDPANDRRGDLAYTFKQYNATYGIDQAAETGNGFLYTLAPIITPGLGPVSKTYDGQTTATLDSSNFTATGAVDGDTVTFSAAAASYDDKNAGTGKTVNASGITLVSATNGQATVHGYQLAKTTASGAVGIIIPKNINLTDATAANKVYDGGTAAQLNFSAEDGVIAGDNVTLGASFDDKNVGAGKPVSVVLSGPDARNYKPVPDHPLAADVTPAPLTITAQTNSKTYDGTVSAAAVPIVTGLAPGDSVVDLSEVYADRNAGTGKTLTVVAGNLAEKIKDGNSGNNYTVTIADPDTTGVILKAPLTITAQTNTKVYDGTVSALSAPLYDIAALKTGDAVTDLLAAYTDKNAGSGKTITVTTYTVNDGNSGNNYDVTIKDATGVITKAPVILTGATADNKVYDGGTSAVVNNATLTNVIEGDNVTLGATNFGDKNVGTQKNISVTLAGTDAGNYQLTPGSALTADITPAPLTITAQTNSKFFDGSVHAAAVPTVSGLLAGDSVTNLSEKYANPTPGAGKTLNVAGYTINDGNGGQNYAVTAVSDTSGLIRQVPDAGTLSVITKSTTTGVVDTAPIIANAGNVAQENLRSLSGGMIMVSPSLLALTVPAPPPFSLAVGGAGRGSISFVEQKGGLTLTVQNPSSTSGSPTAKGALTIYTANGEGVNALGNFSLDAGGGSLTLTPSSAAPARYKTTPGDSVTKNATFSIMTPSGMVMEYSLQLKGPTLVIKPANDAARNGVTGIDHKLVTATGMFAALDKLGASASQVRSVWIYENK